MKTVLIHLSENKELKRYFCLLITGLLCFAVYAQERAHVVIVAGQSNTDGRVPVSDLPEYIRSMGIDSTGFTKGCCYLLSVGTVVSKRLLRNKVGSRRHVNNTREYKFSWRTLVC